MPRSTVLTVRQRAVLAAIAAGSIDHVTARRLGLSVRTVKAVAHDLCQMLGADNRPHLVAVAMRAGLLS